MCEIVQNDDEKYSQCVTKGHQTVFVHIICVKREAGATAAVVLSDEMGKVVMTDNPSSKAASWFKTAQATF